MAAEQAIEEIPGHIDAGRKAKAIAALREYEQIGLSAPLPTLTIDAAAAELRAQGRFAELQAQYMHPSASDAARLGGDLRARGVGAVVHFYMDAQLQGLLQSCGWPHVRVADSLAMGDAAVRMAGEGVRAVLVLGVDFMAENVRAVLDAAGRPDLPVYRLAREPVGCSLAAAADAPAYVAWLRRAREASRARGHAAVHVVYINTSLAAKAAAQAVLPTVTCTSGNVVRTVRQLVTQVGVPLDVYYGPDAYMGRNLHELFSSSEGAIAERLQWYEQGYCVVHHVFGADVVERVRALLASAGPDEEVFPLAHLEVPGEMFGLAFAAQREGKGVVGSTSDILAFIKRTVEDRCRNARPGTPKKTLRFLLGTEAGMATSVVRAVQELLGPGGCNEAGGVAKVDIVFPVSQQAIAPTGDAAVPLVPGVSEGEGCSAAGGCASCPFMKMNTLAGLQRVLSHIGEPDEATALAEYHPKTYPPEVTALGVKSISAMRHFQQHGVFSDETIAEILATRQ